MKTKILGAFGLGVAGGIMLVATMLMSGCFLPYIAAARADDTQIVACSNGVATFELPDSDPTTYLRVTAVQMLTTPLADGTSAQSVPAISFRGDKAVVSCGFNANDRVAFAMR